jgi:hypothetical protein
MITAERNRMTTSQNSPSMTSSRYARGMRSTLQKCSTALLIFGLLALPTLAAAQGTVMPLATHQFFDNNGDPLSGCLLDAYVAGTTTLQDTFTSSTLGTANANPVVCDSAGRMTVFLTPGASYKFRLRTSAGSVLWTVDNVSAVPSSTINLDVDATAGEAIDEGEVVYLATGAGGTTAGRWHLTDSDATGTSISANIIGIARADIASGASGSVRLSGRVDGLTGLTPGSSYYASGTAGGMTTTPPTNRRFLGIAESATVLVMGPAQHEPASPTLASLAALGVIRSNAATGFAISSVAGYQRVSYDTGTSTFNFTTEADAFANVQFLNASATGRYNSGTLQPGFLAYNSATDGANTQHTVDFDTEEYDTTAAFAADTFTVAVPGKYLLCTTVQVQNNVASTNQTTVLFAIAGTTARQYDVATVTIAASAFDSGGGCVIADLVAANTVTVMVASASNTTVVGSSTRPTTFSARLMP